MVPYVSWPQPASTRWLLIKLNSLQNSRPMSIEYSKLTANRPWRFQLHTGWTNFGLFDLIGFLSRKVNELSRFRNSCTDKFRRAVNQVLDYSKFETQTRCFEKGWFHRKAKENTRRKEKTKFWYSRKRTLPSCATAGSVTGSCALPLPRREAGEPEQQLYVVGTAGQSTKAKTNLNVVHLYNVTNLEIGHRILSISISRL